jgi:hypothetical protein
MSIPPEFARFAGRAGEPVPEADPQDVRAVWMVGRDVQRSHPGGQVAIGVGTLEAACSPGADFPAVWHRASQISILTLAMPELLKPWTKDGELTETVFKAAAKIPMEWIGENLRHGLPFDVEDFMRRVSEA